jgi:hypothetical protein
MRRLDTAAQSCEVHVALHGASLHAHQRPCEHRHNHIVCGCCASETLLTTIAGPGQSVSRLIESGPPIRVAVAASVVGSHLPSAFTSLIPT